MIFRWNRRAFSALFAALLATATTASLAQQAPGATAGSAGASTDDKLLGGPSAYGDGYADPYGGGDQQGAKKNDSPDPMANDATAAPGSTARRAKRNKTRDAASTDDTTGLAAPAPSAKKTTEIYKSPY